MKKHRLLRGLIIVLSIIFFIALTIFLVNLIGNKETKRVATSFDSVENRGLEPTLDDDNNYCFQTDEDFLVMQLTDIHLGGGFLSFKKDRMALNAISAMVKEEKPDLIIVTGDYSFAVPYISGTFNNRSTLEIFASLMEKLGVYWTVAFGNHDSESYNYYNRKQISEFFLKGNYSHSLFQGSNGVSGYSNQIINIKNSKGLISKTIFVMDSQAYLPSDPLGIKWEYDNVKEDQIDWYKENVLNLSAKNKATRERLGLTDSSYDTISSFIFMHIPLEEYRDAVNYYLAEDNSKVTYIDGVVGEAEPYVYSPKESDNFFETIVSLNSTKAIFVGHDHLNNISLVYQGIMLTYAPSIDYLAYKDIDKYGSQRGNKMITIKSDTSFETRNENYYQDKYVTKYPKEEVVFDSYY